MVTDVTSGDNKTGAVKTSRWSLDGEVGGESTLASWIEDAICLPPLLIVPNYL